MMSMQPSRMPANAPLTAGEIALLQHWQQAGIIPRRFRAGGDDSSGEHGDHGDTGGYGGNQGGSSGGGSGGTHGGDAYGAHGSGAPNNAAASAAASRGGGQSGGGIGSYSLHPGTVTYRGLPTTNFDENGNVLNGGVPAAAETTGWGAPVHYNYNYGPTPSVTARDPRATAALIGAVNDYRNVGNTPLQNAGNFLAGMANVYEKDPVGDVNRGPYQDQANWNADPIGMAASVVGAVTGLPIGTAYGLATKAFGHPNVGQINLGPDVFGSNPNAMTPSQMEQGGYNFANSSSAQPTQSGPSNGGGSGGIGALAPVAIRAAVPQSPSTTPTTPAGGTTGTGGTVVTDANGNRVLVPFTGDPYTAAQSGGEWNFFTPNPWPVNAADGGKITGPGDGQSDEIPALLSDGEHVIDAVTTTLAGRGSNEAGHRVIEKFKQDIRRKAGMKDPTKAPLMKSIGSYARMQ